MVRLLVVQPTQHDSSPRLGTSVCIFLDLFSAFRRCSLVEGDFPSTTGRLWLLHQSQDVMLAQNLGGAHRIGRAWCVLKGECMCVHVGIYGCIVFK